MRSLVCLLSQVSDDMEHDRMSVRWWLLLTLIISGVCKTAEGPAFEPTAFPANESVIYVLGDEWDPANLEINGTPLEAIPFRGYAVIQLEPGNHILKLRNASNSGRWRITTEAGKEYILKLTDGAIEPGTYEHLSNSLLVGSLNPDNPKGKDARDARAVYLPELPMESIDVRSRHKEQLARQKKEDEGGLPTSLPEISDDNLEYRDLLIGVSASYQSLLASQNVGPIGQSIDSFEDTASVSNKGFTLFLQSTPQALTSHTYYSPSFGLSSFESPPGRNYMKANVMELGIGYYIASGDIYRGNVGFFTGFLLNARRVDLQGRFNFGRDSLYESFIGASLDSATSSSASAIDHIDILNFSRQRSGTLDEKRAMRYVAYKSGVISKSEYMMSDIALSPRIEAKPLAILIASGLSLEQIHKYYSLALESSEKNDVFQGISFDFELGYMGDNFLLKYRASLPSSYSGRKGNIVLESHTITASVFWRF